MQKSKGMISKDEALKMVQLALSRAAMIFHHFSQTLIEELGEEKGSELIKRAVNAYGAHVGQKAKQKAESKKIELSPENFESDLPDMAWKTESVLVEGEERERVHHCPLASEWLEWGDPKTARLYCFVDQAKMQGFNPEYEYVHIKNILDGDPYCELAVRPIAKPQVDKKENTSEPENHEAVRWLYGSYSREDLMKMEPVCLRSLFRERIHHTIEVEIYPILLGQKKIPPRLGLEPQLILEVWGKRGFADDEPDFEWGRKYLKLAQLLRAGEKVVAEEKIPTPFSKQEMQTVEKLIWERCSIRNWIPGKKIPAEMIQKILEAGRAAPSGCNLDIVRFIVINDPEKARMVWSDIPTPTDRCTLIVVCYDKRVYETIGHARLVPHNQLLDCAAAADHMCLMAHALGLGAVWLTCTKKTSMTFKKKYGLPDYMEQALHIAVGWPATGTIKSARMPLKEMMIE